MAKKEAKEETKKVGKKNPSNMTWIILGVIILVLLIVIFSILGDDEDGADESEQPFDEEPSFVIETLGEYETKIVYKRVPGVATEEYQIDCEERGGRFNPCGNGCAPNEQVCDASCYYICELS